MAAELLLFLNYENSSRSNVLARCGGCLRYVNTKSLQRTGTMRVVKINKSAALCEKKNTRLEILHITLLGLPCELSLA